MKQKVKTTFLEMHSAEDFTPVRHFGERMNVRRIDNDSYIGFALFVGIGLPWRWYSRLSWSPDEWDQYFARTNTGTWMAFSGNRLIGFFELEYQADGNTEIKFIGLLPRYIGQGMGGRLLSHAIQNAWVDNTRRVWVHTCDNDAEAALQNYVARGFSVYREEVNWEEIPDRETFVAQVASFYRSYMDRYMIG